MKTTFAGLAVLMLAAMIGCGQGTPGGPGTKGEQPMVGMADDTFSLSVPILSSSLQQGSQMEATIGIKRAKNFDQDVALVFAKVPEGVTIEPASPTINRGDTDAKVTFKAADGAALGDFNVQVTGHPTKGADAQVEFKVSVAAKDSFSLTVPLFSTSVAQGKAQEVSVGITRDKAFDQDVALSFGPLPTGVTVSPDAPVIKPGETEAKLTFTAAPEAALGDFTVKVTGHPTKGVDAANDLKLTVAKE